MRIPSSDHRSPWLDSALFLSRPLPFLSGGHIFVVMVQDVAIKPVVEDRQWLSSYVARADADAFAALVQRYQRMVFAVCHAALGRDSAAADDATQAVFIILARKAAFIRAIALPSWLYRTSQSVVRTMRRDDERRRRRESRAAMPPGASIPSDVIEKLQQTEAAEVLYTAIGSLPAKQRDAIVLCHLMGLEQKDAAVRLGCSSKAVQKRVEAGLESLRKRVADAPLVAVAPAIVAMLQDAARIPLPADLARRCIAAAGGSGHGAAHIANQTLRTALFHKLIVTIVCLLTLPAVILGVVLVRQLTAPIASNSHLPALPSQPSQYRIVDLGAFFEEDASTQPSWWMDTSSRATAINDNGQIVGRTLKKLSDGRLITTAFLWDAVHGMRDLGTLGNEFSCAQGINDKGQVVGYATTHSTTVAWVWDTASGMQPLPYLEGSNASGWTGGRHPSAMAHAINNKGIIAGECAILTSDHFEHPRTAVTWDTAQPGNPIASLAAFVAIATNVDVSSAHGINDAGQIVGVTTGKSARPMVGGAAFLITPVASGGYSSADLWSSSVEVESAIATAINQAGDVVGETPFNAMGIAYQQPLPIDFCRGPILWRAGQSIAVKLGTNSFVYGGARAINNSGIIVGQLWDLASEALYSQSLWAGFIYDQSNGLRQLNELIDLTVGWRVEDAGGINSHNQIAATGVKNGKRHALLLDPLR